MKTLPLSRRRSPGPTGVIPQIFVRGKSRSSYSGFDYIHARIQLRKAKYRYLVWWEDGKKREFYLGQVKTVPPVGYPAAIAGGARSRSSSSSPAGVRI